MSLLDIVVFRLNPGMRQRNQRQIEHSLRVIR